TSNANIIRESAKAGAGIINDIRALQREGALEAAAATNLPVCLMHMQGEPETMQKAPSYENGVVTSVLSFLQERISACYAVGISKDRILLDPGFGFGKT